MTVGPRLFPPLKCRIRGNREIAEITTRPPLRNLADSISVARKEEAANVTENYRYGRWETDRALGRSRLVLLGVSAAIVNPRGGRGREFQRSQVLSLLSATTKLPRRLRHWPPSRSESYFAASEWCNLIPTGARNKRGMHVIGINGQFEK